MSVLYAIPERVDAATELIAATIKYNIVVTI